MSNRRTATLRSVHFIDSEIYTRQIFTPNRYNVPLFVYKRLAGPAERRRTESQDVLIENRRKLFRAMTNYRGQSNWKVIEINDVNQQEDSGTKSVRTSFKSCRKPLRNSHKEWTLPPNRYRLGGSIADLASQSTGSKGPYQCFTGERFRRSPTKNSIWKWSLLTKNDYPHIPTEMDRLAHPRQYFIGKIRPGDKHKQRLCSRLAITQPTLCTRNPSDPGPNHYFKGIFDIVSPTQPDQRQLMARPFVCSVHHSYCAEPFPRPAPGRYELMTRIPPPVPRAQCVSTHKPRLDFTLNPHWDPYRQPATLRMHTVDIPKRRRKRGRNMKVAFGSGNARFKDQEFHPIGALKTVQPVTKFTERTTVPTAVVDDSPKVEAVILRNDSLENFCQARNKLFVIPRRHQTRLSPISIPIEIGSATVSKQMPSNTEDELFTETPSIIMEKKSSEIEPMRDMKINNDEQ
ncbi:uncharacterized protein LOC129774199 [Toxorhynchites rutilus septentrionalis]|uniref:uncharacterized protein LOC129774199 n=1 Tax=Toxorhynchites rutilus septentrionalis TaxID=329112 RepID=UPI00247952B2|nr:uncharacterized protein LOC129774199 [Toxorhynchites rutilus septentrionalis]